MAGASSSNSANLSILHNAIDNLHSIQDVGQMDPQLLCSILPHCTVKQLMTIEEATKGKDLSPFTNELWFKCYKREFGEDNVNMVMKRMKERNKVYKWKALYQAKLMERDEVHEECMSRLRERTKAAAEKKAGRQIKLISIAPPSSTEKQHVSQGSGDSSKHSVADKGHLKRKPKRNDPARGRLMKKARKEYVAQAQWMQKVRNTTRNSPLC